MAFLLVCSGEKGLERLELLICYSLSRCSAYFSQLQDTDD